MKRALHSVKHMLTVGAISMWIVASTITFPLEHALWEKTWPYSAFTEWLEEAKIAPQIIGLATLVLHSAMIVIAVKYLVKRDTRVHAEELESGGSYAESLSS